MTSSLASGRQKLRDIWRLWEKRIVHATSRDCLVLRVIGVNARVLADFLSIYFDAVHDFATREGAVADSMERQLKPCDCSLRTKLR